MDRSAQQDAWRTGLSQNLKPESSGDITVQLQQALRGCRAGKKQVLEIPPGTHHIFPDSLPEKQCWISNHDSGLKRILFDLDGLSDLTIQGNDTELIFHGRVVPFYLKDSQNITVSDLRIDWDRPFLSQAEIVGSGDGFLDLRFSEECPAEVRDGGIVFTGDRFNYEDIDNLLEFDCGTSAPAQGALDNFGFRDWHRAEDLGGGIIRLFAPYDPNNRFVAGNQVIIKNEQRWSPGIAMISCRNIHLNRIDIYHAGGMGVIAQNCRDVFVDQLQVMRRPLSDRAFSVFVDALHFVDCHGKLQVTNCRMENQMDDAINIHGIFLRAAGPAADKTVSLRRMHHQQLGVQTLFAGDDVEFFDDRTLTCIGSARVVDVETVNSEILNVSVDHLPGGFAWAHSVVMRADHDFDVTVSGCTMCNNRSRGILFNAYGRCRIENCFFHTPWQAVRVHGAVDGKWYESGPSESVEITGCTFEQCGYATGHPVIDVTADNRCAPNTVPYHRQVVIHGNRFVLGHANLAEVDNVEVLEFFDNQLEGAAGEIRQGSHCTTGRMQQIKVVT